MVQDVIHTKEELEDIARWLQEDIRRFSGDVVARYIHQASDGVSFRSGRTQRSIHAGGNLNTERMNAGVYLQSGVPTLTIDGLSEATIGTELAPQRFSFDRQHGDLVQAVTVHFEDIPTGIDMYDKELKQFSEGHRAVTITRFLRVHQEVIVTSEGGIAIQSVPFFAIKSNRIIVERDHR
jgi:hypothetical protein